MISCEGKAVLAVLALLCALSHATLLVHDPASAQDNSSISYKIAREWFDSTTELVTPLQGPLVLYDGDTSLPSRFNGSIALLASPGSYFLEIEPLIKFVMSNGAIAAVLSSDGPCTIALSSAIS